MIEKRLDWLAFTFKSGDVFNSDEYRLFLEKFPEIKKTLDDSLVLTSMRSNFYDQVLGVNNDFIIQYRSIPMNGANLYRNMGVNVSIPSHGLEHFFKIMGFDKNNVAGVLAELKARGCSFSRIDLAYDDYSKSFRPADYNKFYANNQMVTPFRQMKFVKGAKSSGCTFYLGSRSKGKMLRVYDKDIESNNYIDAVRYEFEIHGKKCDDYVNNIIEHGDFVDFDAILGEFIIKIIENGDISNRHQGKALKTWEDFKESVKAQFNAQIKHTKVADANNKVDMNIRRWRWLEYQVLPALRDFVEIFGFDMVCEKILDTDISGKFALCKGLHDTNAGKYDFMERPHSWRYALYDHFEE